MIDSKTDFSNPKLFGELEDAYIDLHYNLSIDDILSMCNEDELLEYIIHKKFNLTIKELLLIIKEKYPEKLI